MAQTTYGSITLVDLTDVGQLSVYPTSNMPLSIIYDPDQNSYTPNWGTSSTNLILTPVIYYNNTALTASTTGVTITWRRREGTGNITALTTGETKQSNGTLKVNANKFTPTSTMISYIVTVEYVEPETQTTLTAEGQITFSLVKLASSAKTCIISGDTVFKYNTSGTLISDSVITLTAKTNNVSIQQWQYKDSNGDWTQITGSGTGETLTVNASDTYLFVNDVATIQVITDDENVYDIHCITKLRDGAPGDKAVTAVLTNENQMIPCNSSGTPVSGAFSGAVSQIIIYNGGVDDTANWTISSTGTDVTITRSTTTKANDTVAVTALSALTGKVTFTCTRNGYDDIIKVFSLVKVTAGANGTTPTVYSLECASIAINKTTPSDGSAATYTPSSIEVKGYSQAGNNARAAYSGRFKITSGTTTIYTSTANESSYTITSSNIASAAANGYMTVNLYKAGGTTNLLDTQTIVITSDGAKGDQGIQGNAGKDAINVVMGNYADVIPCTSGNKPQAEFVIDIPFIGYKGTSQVACTVATPPQLLGVTAVVTQATASAVGHVIYTLPTSTNVSAASGTISLVFTCQSKQITHTYTWTRSTAATNGVNAKLFDLYTTNGNIFTSRDSQDITIYARLMDGSTEKTSSCTNWVWSKWENGAYTDLTTTTGKYTVNGSQLTVNNSAVDGYASFKSSCKYSNVTYTAYYVLMDKLDPIQATAFCSLGEQIVNGQGIGAFYVIVTDTGTGQELDALKSDRFLTAAPSNPATGDFYYHLNSTQKTVVLKKYTGSAWADAGSTDLPKGTYTWTFRDSSGNATTFNGASSASGKVIYVDGTLVTKKIIADVKVEI
jgi:hypothetical protein